MVEMTWTSNDFTYAQDSDSIYNTIETGKFKDGSIYLSITPELISSKVDYVTKIPDYFNNLTEETLSKATTVTQHIAKGTYSLRVPLQTPFHMNLNLEKYE